MPTPKVTATLDEVANAELYEYLNKYPLENVESTTMAIAVYMHKLAVTMFKRGYYRGRR
jgi:hypothetical protein